MDLAEKLFLHSQVSVKEFSELILEMTPPLQPNFIPSLYAILNSGCFEEYRCFKYKLRYLNSFVPELYNGAECPLCPKVTIKFCVPRISYSVYELKKLRDSGKQIH
ncbi:PREDICTED: uncharacterized protein LOC107346960 [Acropora digitifera]|uniref:uncharacterized protein LOC107346960 n=1 Tax=Acropora digitifera TaxID=70779 RepID=UPI00077A071A|nr:PREDICTED: uncharacterized protein LOC107346960 [Acropora digitifera]